MREFVAPNAHHIDEPMLEYYASIPIEKDSLLQFIIANTFRQEVLTYFVHYPQKADQRDPLAAPIYKRSIIRAYQQAVDIRYFKHMNKRNFAN